ncbi:FG-GAP-like repeat-containing protein [Pontibacter sp. 13R65]|uniref:FG-GAP-like repeat-containing protein n=1 Tax=Pontibacter sp. 13R65 TaxID=3127458 RepID=UPI00301C0263
MIFRTIVLLSGFLFLQATTAFSQYFAKEILVDQAFKAPWAMAVEDFNNNGRPDIVTSNDNHTASYYIHNANGTLTENILTESNRHGAIVFLEAIDLDGDGYRDIIALTGNSGSNKVMVWYNNKGSFTDAPQVLIQGLRSNLGKGAMLQLYDMDQDGKTDIVLPNLHSSYKVIWLQNRGRNSNWPVKEIQHIAATDHLVVGDLDGVPGPEILTGTTLYSGKDFSVSRTVNIGSAKMILSDMDRDGDLDVVAGPYSSGQNLAWFENKGNGEFRRHEIANSADNYSSILVQDFDQDGLPDIAAGCPTTCRLTFFQNKGNDGFTSTYLTTSTPGFWTQTSMRGADMDQDGKLDLVTAEYGWRLIGMYKSLIPQFEGIQADFNAEFTPCSLTEVKFRDRSLGQGIIRWEWDFGDGSTASVKHPEYTYSKAGTYQVKLHVTSGSGKTSTITYPIKVTSALTIEDSLEFWFCPNQEPFVLSMKNPGVGNFYTWYDASGSPSSYSGNTLTLPKIEQTLLVEIGNQNGCKSKRVPVYIKVTAKPKAPIVEDVVSKEGPAIMRLQASDPDGRQDLVFQWYNDKGTLMHTGPFFEHMFTHDQSYYVQSVSSSGCQPSDKTSASAYVLKHPVAVPEFSWATTVESAVRTRSFDAISDSEGNTIILGAIYGTDSLYSGDITLHPVKEYMNGPVNLNYFLLKYTPDGKVINGSLILRQNHMTNTVSTLTNIQTDEENNIYLIGSFWGVIATGDILFHADGNRIMLKYDSDFNLIWYKPLKIEKAKSSTAAVHVNKDGSFNIEFSIIGQGTIDGKEIGIPVTPNNSRWSQYMLQYSKDNVLNTVREIAPFDYYIRTYSYSEYKYVDNYQLGISRITTDAQDNVYQLGAYQEQIANQPIYSAYPVKAFKTVLQKYSKQGQVLWYKEIAVNEKGVEPQKIVQHNNALYMVLTSSVKKTDGTLFHNEYYETGSAFLCKYDLDGNMLWIRPMKVGQSETGWLYDLRLDKEGNCYVAGAASGPVNLNYLQLQPEIDTEHPYSFIAKYTPDGKVAWSKIIRNTSTVDNPTKLYIAFDKQDQAIVHSNFVRSVALDDIALTTKQQIIFFPQAFVAKLEHKLLAAMLLEGACEGDPASFKDRTIINSSESIVKRIWHFGDGLTSEETNPTHTYVKAGRYKVELEVHGQRGTVSAAEDYITIKPIPVAAITINDTELTASAGEVYRWYRNDTLLVDSTKVLIVDHSGQYRVEVGANNCFNTSDAVSIKLPEPEINRQIEAYPNPAYDQLVIRSNEHSMLELTIYNANGHLFRKQRLNGIFEVTVNIISLPPGLYLAQVELETGEIEFNKFMKL